MTVTSADKDLFPLPSNGYRRGDRSMMAAFGESSTLRRSVAELKRGWAKNPAAAPPSGPLTTS